MAEETAPPIYTHEGNFLTFYERAVQNEAGSLKAGRALFDKVLYVTISSPGDKSNVDYEIEREYPEEYPHPSLGKMKKNEVIYKRLGKYIDDFKTRGNGPSAVSGTPIEHWPLVDTRRVAMLKHNGIYNVESLARLNDSAISTLGLGGRQLVQQAKDWLASAANSALALQTEEKNRILEAKFTSLQEQISDLAEALSSLPSDAQAQVKTELAKRRGRPPKVAAA